MRDNYIGNREPSATCGNGFGAFFFQKKSSPSKSYPLRVGLPSTTVSTVIRLSLMVRTSETSDWYYSQYFCQGRVCTVQECEIMGMRSRLRSRMIMTYSQHSRRHTGTRSLLVWH